MWIILQYVAIFLSQITTEDMQRIADIYNLLYKLVIVSSRDG